MVSTLGERHDKRQTPLVNAGYAARIATMTALVESFVDFHRTSDTMDTDKGGNHVQVVVLGCGLDVLGLWSLDADFVRVYEVDCPEICEAKRHALVSSGILKVSEKNTVDGISGEPVLEGFMESNSDSQRGSTREVAAMSNYVLLSVTDLRDIFSLQKALSVIDTCRPLLVVSELVLAYLGERGTDSILEFCASTLCTAPNSAVIAYEPMGAGDSCDNYIGVHSVTEGYKWAYGMQFESKLERGNAKRGDNANSKDEIYHPLGINCAQVERRIQRAGFSSSYACLAGTATAWSFALQSPELFDEHAALALHLRAYAVVCAFCENSTMALKRRMCPWSKEIRINDAVECMTDSGICILPIESQHQEQVRSLFQQTYQDLYEEYPAVKKMVKTALKTDLSGKKDASFRNAAIDASAIGSRYMGWGGAFIVAIESSTTNENIESHRLVGCVGVRPYGRSDMSMGGFGMHAYEIHRLAVDVNSRGRGIGKAMLAAVERFLALTLGRNSTHCLVATTPAMLKAANQLYQSVGFNLEKQFYMGKIAMNTYLKESDTKL